MNFGRKPKRKYKEKVLNKKAVGKEQGGGRDVVQVLQHYQSCTALAPDLKIVLTLQIHQYYSSCTSIMSTLHSTGRQPTPIEPGELWRRRLLVDVF